MKITLTCLLMMLSFIMEAQTTVFKKIGQRHDIFTASAWKGVDSFRWEYNSHAALTQQNALNQDVSGNWKDVYRYIYTLNSNDKVAEQVRQNWNGSAWVNSTKYTYDHDANGNVLITHYDVWGGSTWNVAGKIEYTGYNAQHKFATETYFIWNGSSWEYLSKDMYQYYPNGYQVSLMDLFNWNSSLNQWDSLERWYYTYTQDSLSTRIKSVPHNGSWLQSNKEIYTYSSSPFLLTAFTTQTWDTSVTPSVWKDDRKTLYTYNPSNQILKSTKDRSTIGGWIEEAREQFVYNTSNLLVDRFDELYLGAWSNNKRSTYTYVGNLVSEEIRYKGLGSGWDETHKLSYLYDANDLNTYRQIDTFNGSVFVPNNRDYYYYTSISVNTNDVIKSVSECLIYPNPTSDVLNMRVSSEQLFQANIKVIDLNGATKLLISQPMFKGENNFQIPTSSLTPGNYLLQLSDAQHGSQFVRKFQVIR